MPEATEDAVFLIATSWQALGRVQAGIKETEECDCTVILVFAAFYIEANISHIIEEMNRYTDMLKFVEARHPGLFPKISWFFKEYVKPGLVSTKDDFYEPKFKKELYNHFDGLDELIAFRNGVAHGDIDLALANQEDAENLREKAKKIVAELFKIAKDNGHDIDRAITYQIARAK